jgi:hypothetical protein
MRDRETKCICRGLPSTAPISRADGPAEVSLLGRFRSRCRLFQISDLIRAVREAEVMTTAMADLSVTILLAAPAISSVEVLVP